MGTLEAVTAQIQQTSDIKALKASLIDSDKLVVAGGSFSQVVTTVYNTSVGSFPGLDILRSVISISAMHDARGRFPGPKCFPNTYTDIKETILEWATQANQPAILYFTGGPKSGKSAVAHEIAETLSSRGTLAGSFFFERDKFQHDGDFFLTLAYQIAVNIPGMDNLVNKAVLRDPTVLEKCGEIQLRKLILEPLFCLPTPETPFTVVVDEFDGCNAFVVRMEIMRLLSRASLTFGDTLRFLFFARLDNFDIRYPGITDGNNYQWVGRHIPLHDGTFPLRLHQLADHFLDPYPSSADSIEKMWLPSSLIQSESANSSSWIRAQRQNSYTDAYRNTFSSSALTKPSTDIIGNSAIVPADFQFSGSPMSVDLFKRQSPHGMVGSPMLIDSLRSSPRYGGSPMLIDSVYLSQHYDFSAGPTSFHAVHQRLDINPVNSPSKLAKEVTEQSSTSNSTYKATHDTGPVDATESDVETVQRAIDFWNAFMTAGEGQGTASAGESTSGLQLIVDNQ